MGVNVNRDKKIRLVRIGECCPVFQFDEDIRFSSHEDFRGTFLGKQVSQMIRDM